MYPVRWQNLHRYGDEEELRSKKSPIRIASHQPEELREKRRKLFDIQQKYAAKNVDTKIKGDKLVFTRSGNIYRDKLGQRPSADEVISGEEIKNPITADKQIEDNGNRFSQAGQRSSHR